MKVAVYAIALNEEKHVRRWIESASEADYLLIADTGSTDNTVAIAESMGVHVHKISVKPWRFDDARNASLALIPEDINYCIALDLDEVLVPGWRKELEKAYVKKITRPGYRFITAWDKNGNPDMEFEGFRVHARQGYRWRYPIHELPTPYGINETTMRLNFEIHHLPDNEKSRGQYLPLLKMAVDEEPESDRNSFYYARELFFHKKIDMAAEEFKRHLSLASAWWAPQRAASLRYLAKCEPANSVMYLEQAIREDPIRREQRVELARIYYYGEQWQQCYEVAKAAVDDITEKPLDYFCEGFAWGSLAPDLVAISAHKLGLTEDAIKYGEMALELDPTNERLINNVMFYKD